MRIAVGSLVLAVFVGLSGCGGGGGSASQPSPTPGGTPAPTPPPPPVPTPAKVENDAVAARFLTQATFGPTLEDIAHLRQLGTYERWIDDQFALPPSYLVPYIQAVVPTPDDQMPNDDTRMEAWFMSALGGPDPFATGVVHRDQLRQRVAYALSQIFVVSDKSTLDHEPLSTGSYYDLLVRDGLGNFRQLLEGVTLHPVMGKYLSMLGNEKPNATLNIRPDENYAREVMQLFSVGLVQLNADGTPALNNGQATPTYDQDTIKGFAHVFTGWRYAGCTESNFRWCSFDRNHQARRVPMVAFAKFHATEQSKQLLKYPGVALPDGLLAVGGTAESDLKAALDNLFNHPNVGPFISRQLIQRLVTSNPTPAYVGRVAAKFNNNGQGVRGDMKAVVKAILLDAEARDPAAQPSNFGKIREPMLRVTHLWRALNARTESGRPTEGRWALDNYLAQYPLGAPSVFNFYRPDHKPIGELTDLGLAAPELQLATDSAIPTGNNLMWDLVGWYYKGNTKIPATDIVVDLSRDMPLAADPGALLDRYNVLFLSGQMSSSMRQTLLDYLNKVPNNNGGRDRVQKALYLITNSPEYIEQR